MRELNTIEIENVNGAGNVADFLANAGKTVGEFIVSVISEPLKSLIPSIPLIGNDIIINMITGLIVDNLTQLGSYIGTQIETFLPFLAGDTATA